MVVTDRIPHTTAITNALVRTDFADTFATTNHSQTMEEVFRLVFGAIPPWLKTLLRVRQSIAHWFGSAVDVTQRQELQFKEGAALGFFKILHIAEKEILMGVDDTHLNVRISLYDSAEPLNNIKFTTMVQCNNFKGRLYMFLIKPFHKMAAKAMLSRVYRK
ncbi:MAG TPA: DUF2867 domain-containing protein [Cytophagales bacterium]|nr:DUF2867 domain-containing protein [Cytophagales bacterium]